MPYVERVTKAGNTIEIERYFTSKPCAAAVAYSFSIHSLASTQRMKLRALGNEEREGTV